MAPAPAGGPGSLVVVTPRRIGTAPERNRVRRRLRALFYENGLFAYPYFCVVIVNERGVGLSFGELTRLVVSAYERYGVVVGKAVLKINSQPS